MTNTISVDATGLPEADAVLTVEKALEMAAALSWEPLIHAPDEWTPPSSQESRTILNMTRLAWNLLFKTKQELVDSLDDMWSTKKGADAFQDWMNSLPEARICLEHCAEVLRMAETRLLCATAAGCADPEEAAV